MPALNFIAPYRLQTKVVLLGIQDAPAIMAATVADDLEVLDENYVRYKNELIVNATTADLSGAITGSVRNTQIAVKGARAGEIRKSIFWKLMPEIKL